MRGFGMITAAAAAVALTLAGCASLGSDDGSPVGVWVNGDARLELGEDGSLSGTDGCNQLSSQWTEEGDTIDFGEVASTLMACEDVDTWLNGLKTAKQDGDVLHVFDRSGEEIGTLQRD